MTKNWKIGVGMLVLVLMIGLVLALHPGRAAVGAVDPVAQPTTGGGAHYTVVSTDGAHLIVVDNTTNKLYFYAIDKDAKIGEELKLRGSANLTDVGKPSIKPIDPKPQK
jgi:hypothetical protein